jgi:hypothetical protein
MKNILYLSINMSLYGYGYRFPRRKRQIELMKTFIAPNDREAWARAAIFNRASVSNNPWVRFLEDRGYYKQIGDILRTAKEEYRSNPYYYKEPDEATKLKQAKALENRKKHLQEEIELLRAYQANPGKLLDEYRTKKFANNVAYADAVLDEIQKLQNELNRLEGKPTITTAREERIRKRVEDLKQRGILK